MSILSFPVLKIQTWKGESMEELKNADKKDISTKRKIGKITCEVAAHFNENAPEIVQDRLTKIVLRESRRRSDEKKEDFD